MRRGFKLLMWLVVGPVGLLLLLVLAWVASNGRWADAAPQPVPAELQPQAVTLAPQDNAFFDVQGLGAPEGHDPNAWGQRAWRNDGPASAPLLAMPSGDAWQCHATQADCMAHWRAAAAALRVQMDATRPYGERCKALATRTAFQEPLAIRPPDAKPGASVQLPQFAPLTGCVRWLHIEAVLTPDVDRAQAAFGQAQDLVRLISSGTQTLIGQAVSRTLVKRHQQLLAQWSAEQGAGFALPAAWLAPLPARALQPRFWMAAESHGIARRWRSWPGRARRSTVASSPMRCKPGPMRRAWVCCPN